MTPRKKKKVFLYNFIYLIVIIGFVSEWPYVVYSKTGENMKNKTQREKYITSITSEYSNRINLYSSIDFRINSFPGSAGSLAGNSIIFISKDMLDEKKYSDGDINFIISHEIGHLKRYDAYRFWTKWKRSWAEEMELNADKIAVSLSGCHPMLEIIKRHNKEFMIGYEDKNDPHPHPIERLKKVCNFKKINY